MIHLNKIPIILEADPCRVITLPSIYPGLARIKNVYKRISNFSDEEIIAILSEVHELFSHRHKDIEKLFMGNYEFFLKEYASFPELTDNKKLLLGASLTKEYSIQSAALFNPSMVPHPDQSGLKEGEKRFIISLRSTGEGHISSIEFRSGIVDMNGNLELDECSSFALTGEVSLSGNEPDYSLSFPFSSGLSERVLFPQTEVESMGMEDVRLVLFNDHGDLTYYGTYTAYNGKEIRSQLLETKDFLNFNVKSLKGPAAQDKGMALFPEKIRGKYAVISRQGGEYLSIMFSEDLYNWNNYQLLMEPEFPFEVAQMGNCGSPVKTPAGWVLLTHGVGPVRQYSISAALLDLNDPTKVIARLDRPFLQAQDEEREGYVPNVVYSCGGMLYGDIFYIPYAMSDSRCGFASVNMDDLLEELNASR